MQFGFKIGYSGPEFSYTASNLVTHSEILFDNILNELKLKRIQAYSKLSHRVTLNAEAREDIERWLRFLQYWNGNYKILNSNETLGLELHLYADASGHQGLGIYFKGHWIAATWPGWASQYSIQWKELFPIYLACLAWGEIISFQLHFTHTDRSICPYRFTLKIVGTLANRYSHFPTANF